MNKIVIRTLVIVFFLGLYAFDIYAFVYNPNIKEICTYILDILYLLIVVSNTVLSVYSFIYNRDFQIMEMFQLATVLALVGIVIMAIAGVLAGSNQAASIFYIINIYLIIVLMLMTLCIDCVKSKNRKPGNV